MRSKASIRGHPMHPAMISAPIGLLVAALIFDILVFAAAGDPWLPAAAVATLAGTTLLALAAVPGLIDYFSVVPKQGTVRQMANRHLALGLLLATLFIVSTIVHLVAWMQTATAGLLWLALALNAAGVAGLMAQGWIGGQMVYGGRVGVQEEEGRGRTASKRGESRQEERKVPARA